MTTIEIYRERIPEIKVEGMPLGRNIHIDSRSADYPFTSDHPRTSIDAHSWARQIGPLDQGNLGSCTGNALVGCVATTPLYETLPIPRATLDELLAVKAYSLATQLDSAPGAYPPNDTGSDGISVAKAGVQLGLISAYTHCFDIATVELSLQTGPGMLGMNWYSSFDRPDSNGLVTISSGAYVRGGHEVEVLGIEPSTQMIYAINSWGMSWGVAGLFHFSYADLERLLAEQGDYTVPLPLGVTPPQPPPTPDPVPVPVPTPTPDDVDLQLWNSLDYWAHNRHSGSNRVAANDVIAWGKIKGYPGA